MRVSIEVGRRPVLHVEAAFGSLRSTDLVK